MEPPTVLSGPHRTGNRSRLPWLARVLVGLLAVGVLRRPRLRALSFIEQWTGRHWSWAGSVGLGLGLMAWIVVQLALVEFRSFLQPLMFGVGALLVLMPLLPTVRRHLAV